MSGCAVTSISPVPSGIYCGVTGTLARPAFLSQPFVVADFNSCALPCVQNPSCQSFAYSDTTHLCSYYTLPLNKQGLDQTPDRPVYDGNKYYNKGCFGIYCTLPPVTPSTGSRTFVIPTPPVSPPVPTTTPIPPISSPTTVVVTSPSTTYILPPPPSTWSIYSPKTLPTSIYVPSLSSTSSSVSTPVIPPTTPVSPPTTPVVPPTTPVIPTSPGTLRSVTTRSSSSSSSSSDTTFSTSAPPTITYYSPPYSTTSSPTTTSRSTTSDFRSPGSTDFCYATAQRSVYRTTYRFTDTITYTTMSSVVKSSTTYVPSIVTYTAPTYVLVTSTIPRRSVDRVTTTSTYSVCA